MELLTRILVMLGLYLYVSSCSGTTQKNVGPGATGSRAKPAIIRKPASSFADTLRVEGGSAVFYSPDSLQMEKIREVNEKEIFAMLTHDCHYQMQNAREVMRKYWPQIRIREASKFRYLLFVRQDKRVTCIDLNERNDICGLFLFDGKKDPVAVDMPNIDTALGFYFKNTL